MRRVAWLLLLVGCGEPVTEPTFPDPVAYYGAVAVNGTPLNTTERYNLGPLPCLAGEPLSVDDGFLASATLTLGPHQLDRDNQAGAELALWWEHSSSFTDLSTHCGGGVNSGTAHGHYRFGVFAASQSGVTFSWRDTDSPYVSGFWSESDTLQAGSGQWSADFLEITLPITWYDRGYAMTFRRLTS